MNEEFKNRIARWITVFLVVAIIIGGTVLVLPTYRRGRALRLKDAELQAKIEAKRRDIAALTENQRRFRVDPDFVEQIARQNRRIYPGELVFVFDEGK